MKKAVLGVCVLAAALTVATPVQAGDEEGPFMARLRLVNMKVDNGNSPNAAVGKVEVDDKVFPEIDFTYFFTPNLAAELVLTYPLKHDVKLNGTDIGSIKRLPPSLLLQYHFTPGERFKPYIGAGLNYTHFSSVDLDIPGADIDRRSFGVALQAGVDIRLAKHWYLNFDVKYIDIDTDVKLNGVKLTTLEVDPMLYNVGIGYRF
ncbi:MAG TPA: OmpW family outer membrane protein [Burkholderiales bacterium]